MCLRSLENPRQVFLQPVRPFQFRQWHTPVMRLTHQRTGLGHKSRQPFAQRFVSIALLHAVTSKPTVLVDDTRPFEGKSNLLCISSAIRRA